MRFFASLREQVGIEQREIDAAGMATAADVWSAVTGDWPLTENVIVAVNMDYVKSSASVSDGDEVAFFPPVTGG